MTKASHKRSSINDVMDIGEGGQGFCDDNVLA